MGFIYILQRNKLQIVSKMCHDASVPYIFYNRKRISLILKTQ